MYNKYLSTKPVSEIDHKHIRFYMSLVISLHINKDVYVKEFITKARKSSVTNKTLSVWLGVSLRTVYRLTNNPELVSEEKYHAIYERLRVINVIDDTDNLNNALRNYAL